MINFHFVSILLYLEFQSNAKFCFKERVCVFQATNFENDSINHISQLDKIEVPLEDEY